MERDFDVSIKAIFQTSFFLKIGVSQDNISQMGCHKNTLYENYSSYAKPPSVETPASRGCWGFLKSENITVISKLKATHNYGQSGQSH